MLSRLVRITAIATISFGTTISRANDSLDVIKFFGKNEDGTFQIYVNEGDKIQGGVATIDCATNKIHVTTLTGKRSINLKNKCQKLTTKLTEISTTEVIVKIERKKTTITSFANPEVLAKATSENQLENLRTLQVALSRYLNNPTAQTQNDLKVVNGLIPASLMDPTTRRTVAKSEAALRKTR